MKSTVKLYLLLFLCVFHCWSCRQNTQKSSENRTPALKKISGTSSKAHWVKLNDKGAVPRVVKTPFKLFGEKPFHTNRFKKLNKDPDSLPLTFASLPSRNFDVKALTRKKIHPTIILMSRPKKTKASYAIVEPTSTSALLQISGDQGLPGTSATGFAQDKNGHLWIGTDHGLTLYDGTYFNTWYKQNGLSRDETRFVFKDSRGHLWVGGSGVDEIIPEKGLIKHYGKKEGLSHQGIASVKEDSKGRIYFTLLEGVDILDPATNEITHIGTENGLSAPYVNTLCEDKSGRIWMATNGGGVNIVDFQKQKITYLDERHGLSNNDIRDIIIDKDNRVWFGGWYGGLDYYDVQKGVFFKIRDYHGLCDKYIRALKQDHRGNIWVACLNNGIDVYDPVNKTIAHLFGEFGVVKSDSRCLFEDNNNRMWIGTNGYGLLLNDDLKGTLENFDLKYRYAKASVNALLEDSEGNYWIGTAGQGLDFYNTNNNSLHHLMNEDWTDGWINQLYDDGKGRVWMTTEDRLNCLNKKNNVVTSWGKDEGMQHFSMRSFRFNKRGEVLMGTSGGLDKFDTLKRFFYHLEADKINVNFGIAAMDYAPDGALWLATYREGIMRLDTGLMEITHFDKTQIGKVFINCILPASDGKIYIGTSGDGLKIFDPRSNTLRELSSNDGLAEMSVFSLLESEGKIYAGTIKGLTVIEREGNDLKFSSYDKPQGFIATDFNQNAVMKSRDKRIWWGIGEILSIYRPSENKKITGKAFITSIDLMGNPVNWQSNDFLTEVSEKDTLWSAARDTFYFKNSLPSDTGFSNSNSVSYKGAAVPWNIPRNLELPYFTDHVTIHFNSNFISASNRTLFKYKLAGLDDRWSGPTSDTRVDYRNLSPGSYTFNVCCSNFDSPYSSHAEFIFNISPPWWGTKIAYAGYGILFIGMIFGYNRIKTRQLLKRQFELETNVRDRTKEIAQQKLLVEEKQKEILDSINYAKRIQYTLLAHDELLRANLKDVFILFHPKDIVSGDFYWATRLTGASRDLFFLAVCDSTGHGVPGAFMSLLNISFLNEAINEKKIESPDEILNYVRERLVSSISKDGAQDGMDGILLCIDNLSKKVSYSAANNNPVLVRNGIITELPCNKMPVGKGERDELFSLQTPEIIPGDTLYLYTDGYADQFGGEKGKKFKYKRLNELLLNISAETPETQKSVLLKNFTEWKGDLEQVDDVCVIGIKF